MLLGRGMASFPEQMLQTEGRANEGSFRLTRVHEERGEETGMNESQHGVWQFVVGGVLSRLHSHNPVGEGGSVEEPTVGWCMSM